MTINNGVPVGTEASLYLTRAREALASVTKAWPHDAMLGGVELRSQIETTFAALLTQVRNETLGQADVELEALARTEDEEFEKSSHPDIKRNALMKVACFRRAAKAIRSLKSPG